MKIILVLDVDDHKKNYVYVYELCYQKKDLMHLINMSLNPFSKKLENVNFIINAILDL